MPVTALEGYRIWSRQYDRDPNPLLSLEMRTLAGKLEPLAGRRVLDAGSGTGRWMAWAEAHGANVFGVDLCREMVIEAANKPGLRGRSVIADVRELPIQNEWADTVICSFTLGYVPAIESVFRELARVARRVIVSDLHPEAARRGWTRSFRTGDRVYQLEHHCHSRKEMAIAAKSAGLAPVWQVEATFGDPEREIFRRAGKSAAFESVREIPAVLITAWDKTSR
jgi:ubiquinone/menaquinone biosynthesis C-methylase UbiE